MKTCGDGCIPCCDFCIHAIQGYMEYVGEIITTGPVGCMKHTDAEHQNIARACYYCDDFYCFNVWDDDENNNN